VDFGTLYFNCSVADLLHPLSDFKNASTLSFHQQNSPNNFSEVSNASAGEKKEPAEDAKIIVTATRQLEEKALLDYLQKRSIPPHIADRFCREVDFLLYGKKNTVIGFQNNAGGFELRGPYFKGSSSPKETSFFDNGKGMLDVFEGFFNYLSYQTMYLQKIPVLTNFLVFNSLAFFEKEKERMENHQQINLYLDNDTAGKKYTQQALEWSKKFVDQSDLYKEHKGELLAPPTAEHIDKLPELVRHEFSIKEAKTDVVFSGLGWITVQHANVVIAAYAPRGVEVFVRQSLI
jgi:hypothetical protein